MAVMGGWCAWCGGKSGACSRRTSLECLAVCALVLCLAGVAWMSLETMMLVPLEEAVRLENLLGPAYVRRKDVGRLEQTLRSLEGIGGPHAPPSHF
jgi:hypothetical protein